MDFPKTNSVLLGTTGMDVTQQTSYSIPEIQLVVEALLGPDPGSKKNLSSKVLDGTISWKPVETSSSPITESEHMMGSLALCTLYLTQTLH